MRSDPRPYPLASSASPSSAPGVGGGADPFILPPLPYDRNALQPAISSQTMDFHYGKHHQAYVTNLNAAVKGTDLAAASLEEIILSSAGQPGKEKIFNNAAQVWNHTFYWQSMRPKGGGTPTGVLQQRIEEAFGSLETFLQTFAQAATTHFGSGWVWLVEDGDSLKVVQTANADTPMTRGQRPLLTIDVWEHAYYLDFQNRRPDYVKAFMETLVNWDFATKNLGG